MDKQPTFRAAFNLKKWIEENRDLLKPPVGNKDLYIDSGDFIVMIVGGPNARKDYHYNETEELFYQLEGRAVVRIQTPEGPEDIELGPDDMFLLPAKIPHNPIRDAGSVGLVIERKRKGSGKTDGLMWFCDSCNHPLHVEKFELRDIERDFLPRFKDFYSSEALRTCKGCGEIMPTDSRFIG